MADQTTRSNELTVAVRIGVALALVTISGGLPFAASMELTDRDDAKFVYAVKVQCGFPAGDTTINVHNPHGRALTITEKSIPLEFGVGPMPPRNRKDFRAAAVEAGIARRSCTRGITEHERPASCTFARVRT